MTNVTALLTQLVAFDTTSSESNLALIEFVERYLADYGVTAERVMSPCGTKANLIARIGPDAPTRLPCAMAVMAVCMAAALAI